MLYGGNKAVLAEETSRTGTAERDQGSPRPGTGRLPAVDVARGLAICGMLAFHLDWDLAYWGWLDTSPADSRLWMAFGHAVASAFLFVSGFCLVLARRGTVAALRRIAFVGAAAAGVSAATGWLFPDEYIFFGILHCIAVSNLVGLAFVGMPAGITALAGLAAMAAPRLPVSEWFNGPGWWWLGLSADVRATLDYRPLLPWLAAVLFGIAAARLIALPPERSLPASWSKPLVWAGRHSLPIYVVHQPIMFGVLALLAMMRPITVADELASFNRQCLDQCVAAGAGQAGCSAACGCMLDHMRDRIGPNAAPPPSTTQLQVAGEACVRQDPSNR